MQVKRALISVADKFGIDDFARGLVGLGIEIVASAGTRALLLERDVPVTSLEAVTGYPDGFMGGRVKTLHPGIHAAILADRDERAHMQDLRAREIVPIDLVCVNLYRFGDTDQDEVSDESAISHIDIGGPMMIRSAALNHRHVAAIVRPASYIDVLDELRGNDNRLAERDLADHAAQAFAHVAAYEASASEWFSQRYRRRGGEGA